MAETKQYILQQLTMLEHALSAHGRAWLLPSGFSAADIACGYSVSTYLERGLIEVDRREFPCVAVWVDGMRSRRSYRRAMASVWVSSGPHAIVPSAAEGDVLDSARPRVRRAARRTGAVFQAGLTGSPCRGGPGAGRAQSPQEAPRSPTGRGLSSREPHLRRAAPRVFEPEPASGRERA